MQKKVHVFMFMILLILLLAACTPASNEEEQAPAGTLPAIPTVEPTNDTPTPLPTSDISPTATSLPPNQQNLSFQGVSFNYDLSLATVISSSIVAGVGGGPAIPDFAKSGVSAHFEFSGYPVTTLYQQQPHIDIFDTQDYANISVYAGQEIENLKQLLAERPAESQQLPYLPVANALQVFRTQIEYLDFVGGSGVRFVTYYAQDVSPVTNENIFYTFQGLTNDGRYYIAATFPVTAPFLPANYDSAPITDYDAFATNYQNYLQEIVVGLNDLTSAEFTPNLALLDGIFQSMTIATDLGLPQTEIPTLTPCSVLPRPALVAQRTDFGNVLTFFDPAGNELCDLELQTLDSGNLGQVQAANGHLFYAFYDWMNSKGTVWHVAPDGSQSELTFMAVTDPNTFSQLSFTVAPDGSKIAWAYNSYDEDANHDHASLFVANIDGSNQVTLLNQAEINDSSIIQPVRFSQDNTALTYAIQPYGIGGSWVTFTGRYQTIYTVPAGGGTSTLLFDCTTINQSLCIGDLSVNGQALVYTNQSAGTITIIDSAGNEVSTLTISGLNHFSYPTFSPSGVNLAYYSANITDIAENGWPLPKPGNIHFIAAPFKAEPATLVSNDHVSGIWNWLNDTTLIYTEFADNGNVLYFLFNLTDSSSHLIPVMTFYPLAVMP